MPRGGAKPRREDGDDSTLASATLAATVLISPAASAQDAGNHEGATPADVARVIKPEFSPYAGRSFPTRPLFGDTHLHTAVSVDAGTMNRLGQEDAFRFARGEEVTSTGGLRAKLSRPLDFLVIADHAEMYGLMPQLLAGDPEVLATEAGQRWYGQLTSGDLDTIFATAMEIVGSLSGDEPPIRSESLVRNSWQAYTALADRYNDPGIFTTIIGFEWTAIGGYNLHRNVLFRGDARVADQTLPFSQFDSKNPEDLWTYMEAFEEGTGSDLLAIPHNGNLSNGRMFSVESFDGQPLTAELAARRIRNEPLIEATQIKGDGESHPFLSPADEFAGYEIWDRSNLNGTEAKTPDMLKYEYAREALKTGLKLGSALGVNPYKFGMIGSTGSHTSLSTSEEDNFFGKHSGVEPEPHRWDHVVIEAPDPAFTVHGWQQAASGLAAVWATGNTREAIFDAMQRKETYATTGARMTVLLLRRLGLHPGGRHVAPAGRRRLPEGRADGRRPARRSRGPRAELPRRRAQGSVFRQSRPHPDRQGLARCDRRRPGAGLRRRLERRPPAGRRRQAAARRQHRRRRPRHLDQPHRRPRADRRLDRPRLRPRPRCLLLRQGHRDPDPALDRLRGAALRHHHERRRADDHPGARLHLADLVYARIMTRPVPLALALLLAATAAAAHDGDVAGGGFVTGFLHPILGWDHVAAMVAVGLWGAFLGPPAIWLLPVTFPLVMALGGALGVAGVPVPGIETGIAASALIIGVAVLLALRPPLVAAAVIVGFFAIFHGHAHGAEMPQAASPLAYAAGFVIGTGLLHLAGIALGLLARSQTGALAVRAMGGVIAMAGLGFLTGAL